MSAYDTYLKQSGGATPPSSSGGGSPSVVPKPSSAPAQGGGSAYARYLNQSNGTPATPATPAPSAPASPELTKNPIVAAITGGTTLKQFGKDFLGSLPEASKKVSDFLINKPINYLGTKLYEANPTFFDEASAGIDIQAKEGHKNAGVEVLKTLQQGERAISGLTGGIITPDTQTPDNLVSKIYGGFAQAIGTVVALQGIGTGLQALTDTKAITSFLAERPLLYKYALPYIQNAVGFSLYGQLDPTLAGHMTERLKTLGMDIVTSVPYTLLGGVKNPKISIPASFTLGFGMAKLSGASNEDAFISGVVLGGLDGYSRFGGVKEHFIDGRAVEKKLSIEALKTLNEYSDKKLTMKSSPEELKQAWRKAIQVTHPDHGGDPKDFIRVSSAYQFLAPKGVQVPIDSPVTKTGSEVVPKPEAGVPSELPAPAIDPAKLVDTKAIDLQKQIEAGGVPTSEAFHTKQPIAGTSNEPLAGEVTPVPEPSLPITPAPAPVETSVTPRVGTEVTAKPAYEAFKASTPDSSTPTPPAPTEANRPLLEPVKSAEKVPVETKLRNKYPDVKLSLKEDDKTIKVKQLDVPAGDKEMSRKILSDLVDYADAEGKKLELPNLPADHHAGFGFKATKTDRLTRKPLPKEEVHFRTKTKVIDRLKEAHTPEQRPELVKEVSNAYYDQVIKPRMEKGEAIIIGADDMKDYFGNDYDIKNHPIYSESANNLFRRAVTESKNETVKFLAGGTGSGKSDFIVPSISEDFDGVVYDSTAWNPDGMLEQIAFVESHGKNAEVYGIIPNLEKSRAYTFLREQSGKHPVTEKAFINTHSGSIDTMIKVIEQGGDVYVADMREPMTKEQLENIDLVHNPIDLLQGLGYNKEHVKQQIENVTAENAKEIVSKGQEGNSGIRQENGSPQEITQKETVKKAVAGESKSIKQLALETGIKEPNIRRILGEGAKEGVFERVEKGVYILNNGKEDIAFIHTADAVETLPRLAKEGLKVDMVFLDIPYNTPAVKGGNRGVNYNLISVPDFRIIMNAVSQIVKDDTTPVYYMFSQAKSGMTAMLKYNDVLNETGFKPVARGDWQKMFDNGKPVTNVRGEVAKPEGILLLNKAGEFQEKDAERNLDFTTRRPKGYSTEKPAELLRSLILQGTKQGDKVLDPFAGSGVTGAEAVKAGRKAVLIEKDKKVSENITQPRVRNALGLMDRDPTYTDHMNELIQHAQENGGTFPYTEMSKEEQAIVDAAFRNKINSIPVTVPKDYKPYERTMTGDTVDVTKLADPTYLVRAYESTFARGGTDEKLYKILTKALVPEGREASGYLADLYNEAKAVPTKTAEPNNKDLRIEAQPAIAPDESRTQTEVQGQKINRFTGRPQDNANPRVIGQQKPLVTKSDLKTILSTNPEFRNAPFLTVEGSSDEDKVFAWSSKDGKTAFKLKPSALGLVTANLEAGDRVRISADTFKNTGQELRVMKYDSAGGSSRYASIGRYRDDTAIALGQSELIKPIEFPELVKLAKELMGDVPFIKKYTKANGMFYARDNGAIGLNPDLFKAENNGQFAKTLAHEIGHLIDYLPDHLMQRGNLMGRLNTLKGFMKDFYAPAGVTRSDPAMRKELWELSKYWKPIDEATASPSHLAYRKSAPELYADFISVLFNAPRTVTEMAPESYNTFFQQLDAKPLVKQAYFELQDFLRNGDKVASRRKDTQEMFKVTEQEARERQIQFEIQQEEKKRSVWFKFKHEFVDITEAVREKVKADKKAGVIISDNNNPQYYLEERNYLGGKIKATVEEKFNSIYQELQKQGMAWEDLGELMFYERILKGDRQEVANPLGFQPDFVKELYDGETPAPIPDSAVHTKGVSDMKSTLGEDKFAVLQKLADEYRGGLRDLFKQGREAGLYNAEQEKMFSENLYYVPFKGAAYSGTKSTFGIKHQKGTLGGIENPANTGIEKAISIVKAIERNKVTQKTVDYFVEHHGDEVIEAPKDQNGFPIDPKKETGLGLVTYMQDGKVKGFHVDKYIADAIKKDTVSDSNVLISSLRFANSGLFRPLFITFNLGFQSFNAIRDFKRFYKNVPDMTFLKALGQYAKSARAAKIRAFGLPKNPSPADIEAHDLITNLEKSGVLGITYNDIARGEDIEAKQIDRILQGVGLGESTKDSLGLIGDKLGVTKKSAFIKPFITLLDTIENLGNMIETLPKVAGVKFLEDKMPPMEMRSFVRKYVGSPDFQAGGKFKKYSNEIFLFSNAIAHGIRSDFEIASDPKTRGGYWYKTAKVNLAPKLLLLLASLGLFGEGLKELLGKISEYDKTNYTIVPVGIDNNGKAVYIRIPEDETGKIISGMFWKVANAIKDPKELGDVATYTDLVNYAGGQAPSVSPVITTGVNIAQFVGGANPYDFFRGRPVLSDQQMQAGGLDKAKPFASFLFEQMGGGIFAKLYTNETVPKTPSLSEKVVQLPVVSNVLGRFLKTSNYGETESLRKITDEVKSVNAHESLQNKKTVYDAVDSARGLPYAQANAIKHEMIKQIYGGQPKTPEDRTQARAYEKRFDTLRLRGTADPRLDALLTAQSNDEKVALLKEYKKSMSTNDFNDLKRFIITNRVVSSAVFQAFNRVEK